MDNSKKSLKKFRKTSRNKTLSKKTVSKILKKRIKNTGVMSGGLGPEQQLLAHSQSTSALPGKSTTLMVTVEPIDPRKTQTESVALITDGSEETRAEPAAELTIDDLKTIWAEEIKGIQSYFTENISDISQLNYEKNESGDGIDEELSKLTNQIILPIDTMESLLEQPTMQATPMNGGASIKQQGGAPEDEIDRTLDTLREQISSLNPIERRSILQNRLDATILKQNSLKRDIQNRKKILRNFTELSNKLNTDTNYFKNIAFTILRVLWKIVSTIAIKTVENRSTIIGLLMTFIQVIFFFLRIFLQLASTIPTLFESTKNLLTGFNKTIGAAPFAPQIEADNSSGDGQDQDNGETIKKTDEDKAKEINDQLISINKQLNEIKQILIQNDQTLNVKIDSGNQLTLENINSLEITLVENVESAAFIGGEKGGTLGAQIGAENQSRMALLLEVAKYCATYATQAGGVFLLAQQSPLMNRLLYSANGLTRLALTQPT